MKIIQTDVIEEKIAKLCIDINAELNPDVLEALQAAEASEISETGRGILALIHQNIDLAQERHRPICQDTGMTIVFVKLGQDVHIEGGCLENAIQAGVRKGYAEGFLRKSVVADPLLRTNTNDNTPAIIHYQIVEGESLEITVMAKGFGSENTSALKMLKPSDGIEGVKKFVLETISKGAPNACAPIIVGVGLGGTFEKAALLSKEALTIPLNRKHPKKHLATLENEILTQGNALGIGPMGMGGLNTVLGVHILDYPTHIAGLPVAVNLCCYVDRHGKVAI